MELAVHLGKISTAFAGATAAYVAVYASFRSIDNDQSNEQRRFMRDWLLGLKVDDQKWESFFKVLFSTLFGERHLSLKCAFRSFILSCALVVAVLTLRFYQIAALAHGPHIGLFDVLGNRDVLKLIFGACVADYISLGKTRWLLTRISVLRSGLRVITLVGFDFVATTLCFIVILPLVAGSIMWLQLGGFGFTFGPVGAAIMVWADMLFPDILYNWYPGSHAYIEHDYIPTIELYAVALLTSAWLWMYVGVAYGLRILGRLPNLLRWMSKGLDFENHPVRIIGHVAALASAIVVGACTLLWAG